MRAPWLLLATVGALAVGPRVAVADDLRLVWLVTDDQASVVPRVEGQLADLPVTLEVVPTAAAPAGLEARHDAALAVARAHRATAALWLQPDGDGWIVLVASADGARLLVRRVDARAEGLTPSAAIESAAMIVRTAARGLAQGVELGDPVTPRRPGWRAWALVGGRASVDDRLGAGLSLRLGAARGRLRLAAGYQQDAASTVVDPDATLELRRLALDLGASLDVVDGPRWAVRAGLALGAARFARATTATAPELTATAAAVTWSPVASVAAHAARRLTHGVRLDAAVGVDLIARPPRFAIVTDAGARTVATTWPAQPWLAIGILLETDP